MANTETRFGTFEELLANVANPQNSIARALRALIQEIDPDTTEVVRLGDNAATYGVGPRKMKEGYCYVMPLKARVNLGFYSGALLDDPTGLLEGTGKKLRHIKVNSADMVGTDAMRALILAAVEERRAANS